MRRAAGFLATIALLTSLLPAAVMAAPSTHGSWIVTLRDGVDPSTVARGLGRSHGATVGYVYRHALNGFSFRGSEAAANALLRNPQVASLAADAEVQLQVDQTNEPWGLDRIDQPNLPLNSTYTYTGTGAGVTAYVIDSGINFSHVDFSGRAVSGYDAIDGGTADDCNGHGTHVAGTIGGERWGVAKDVTLVAVRVFDCTGSSAWSTIIAGIDWVTATHPTGTAAVANLSLGGPANSEVDAAVRAMITDGVATAIAAGNGDWLGRARDACNYSPARVAEAMTISATDSGDRKASWANYGNCVDWFGPGVSIESASHTSTSGTSTKSGTSMAAPHTAGVAALYLEQHPSARPDEVHDALFAQTTKDVVTSSSTANNDMLYMGFLNGGGGGTTPDAPPTVAITSPGAGATVSGTVTITATATDDKGVAKVDFYRGSTLIATDSDGTDGWSGSWDTTQVANATYSLTARATDTVGQTTTSTAVSVTVANSSGGGTSFGLALSGAGSGSGSNWTSTVTITARDASGSLLSNVSVTGGWSNGGTASCATNATGTCSVSRSQHKRVASVTFTVSGASHATVIWDGGPDSMTVAKP